MTEQQEKKIRAWMGFVGETDKALIDDYIQACHDDPDTLKYFMERAQDLPSNRGKTDARSNYKFTPPFSVDRASQATRDAEMEKIKRGPKCRSSKKA